jgi:hypothetical protein
MLKNFRDRVALSGFTVLIIGVILLMFTFVSAYGFLTQGLSIVASQDLVQTFGEALAPLIATCIRIMYLGVMGWIGSLLTIRGVTIMAHTPQAPVIIPQQPQPVANHQKPQPQAQSQQPQKPKAEKPKAEKPKEEVKPPPEPEIIVIPPEEVAPQQPTQPQQQPSEQKEQTPQNNGSSQQPANQSATQ